MFLFHFTCLFAFWFGLFCFVIFCFVLFRLVCFVWFGLDCLFVRSFGWWVGLLIGCRVAFRTFPDYDCTELNDVHNEDFFDPIFRHK